MPALALPRRRVGRTALEVTVLGLGTATMGGSRVPVTRAHGEAIVSAAWNAGVRYVDTAPYYGVGAAERRVGDALRDHPREEWVLSTKVGRLLRPSRSSDYGRTVDGRFAPLPFDVEYDYSYDGVMRSVDDSLQRLGLSRIDILFVHDIGIYQHGVEGNKPHMQALREGGYRAMHELRRAGAVNAIGVGVNEAEVLVQVMDFGDWDVFLLAGRYTLLEQGPLDELLPLCQARDISVVIGGPFNSGILAGRDTWNYARAPDAVVERVRRLQEICDAHAVPLPAAALQFPLGHPSVCSVIPGPRTAAEFEANRQLFATPIPSALWSDLKTAGLLRQDAPLPA